METHISVSQYKRLIEEYNLKQEGKGSGKNIYLHCPFHDDTKASLSINQDTGEFNCFNPDCSCNNIRDGRSQNVEFFEWLLENIEEQFKY